MVLARQGLFFLVKYSATVFYPLGFSLLLRISDRKIGLPAPMVAFTVAWLLEGWGGGGGTVYFTLQTQSVPPE
jgi:hypothetical protein